MSGRLWVVADLDPMKSWQRQDVDRVIRHRLASQITGPAGVHKAVGSDISYKLSQK